jgi:polyhydroxyalkanoate synthesis regulator phasin
MKELLRKAWFFGLGLFDFTREKVEAVVQEMVQRGEITQQESPEAVQQLLARAQEAQQALVDNVKTLVQKVVGEINPARAADLEALEKRLSARVAELEALERRVNELEKEFRDFMEMARAQY